ncbi:MAG: NACHT domain-containing protein [Myxococcales bacterium]|nr:MAG: NACHT domain-containing protein [Myxococcales bacterium]
MIEIDWNSFKAKNKAYHSAFEQLCYHLFCREHRQSKGIYADFNQVGLETEPICVNGEWYGFQAKFFDTKIDYDQIQDSISKAINAYPKQLDHIEVYTNRAPGNSFRNKKKKQVDKLGKNHKIDIIWIVPSCFQSLLNKPSNLDLASLYFGKGDILKFIQNSTHPPYQTLVASKHFVDLPISADNCVIRNLKDSLVGSSSTLMMLTGHPGSGKSVLVHKLFRELAGFSDGSSNWNTQMLNHGVPVIVNLKNCISSSLETILSQRQNECEIQGAKYNFFYLLDGLDELAEDVADRTLSFVKELCDRDNVSKILISCRTGNRNKTRARTYFPDLNEVNIGQLNRDHVTTFFEKRENKEKTEKLKSLQETNPNLVDEIRDVLILNLFWEEIQKLDERSSAFELLDIHIRHLLYATELHKQLASLSLPYPKEKEILGINRQISTKFQESYQFRFPQYEIQKILLDRYPRNDYCSTNDVLSYIASLFFDCEGENGSEPTYVYRHRRFQEYFYIQHLEERYQKSVRILRDTTILGSKDLLENLFIPYLKHCAEEKLDICRITEINLLELYLGKNPLWGADSPYYLESKNFALALALQTDNTFEELMLDPQLELERKLFVDSCKLEEDLEAWKRNTRYASERDLLRVFEEVLGNSLSCARRLSENHKNRLGGEIYANYKNTRALFDKYKFSANFKHQSLVDPIEKHLTDFFYLLLEIDKVEPDELLKQIRCSCEQLPNARQHLSQLTEEEKVFFAFFEACIQLNLVEKLIDVLEDQEIEMLLAHLTCLEHLHLLLGPTIKPTSENLLLKEVDPATSRYAEKLIFIKKFYTMSLCQKEVDFIEGKHDEYIKRDRHDWRFYCIAFHLALTGFVLDKSDIGRLLQNDGYRIGFDISIYQALFKSYSEMLRGEEKLENILLSFRNYLDTTEIKDGSVLEELSEIWAYLIADGYRSQDQNQLIREILFKRTRVPSLLQSLYRIRLRSPNAFMRLVSGSDLLSLEEESHAPKDRFPELVDQYFELSILNAGKNDKKAKDLFLKGIHHGTLRHLWHKDHIVSWGLVHALNTMLSSNFIDRKDLESYVDKVFVLTTRALKISDGDETKYGPKFLVKTIAKFDIDLAEKLLRNLEQQDYGLWNQALTSTLLEKISLHVPLSVMEKELSKYQPRLYSMESSEGYEEKFVVYLSIAKATFTTKVTKKLLSKEPIKSWKSSAIGKSATVFRATTLESIYLAT